MTRLRFNLILDVERPLSDAAALREWERIAKRLERAAKGRSKVRTVSIGPGR